MKASKLILFIELSLNPSILSKLHKIANHGPKFVILVIRNLYKVIIEFGQSYLISLIIDPR